MKGLIIKARYLRHEETKAEKILWKKLRNRNLSVKFRRQHPIDNFILDFYAPEINLAIELDGSIHNESKEYDKIRTEYLKSKKVTVVRFWNSKIENNLEAVLNEIQKHIDKFTTKSPPSTLAERNHFPENI